METKAARLAAVKGSPEEVSEIEQALVHLRAAADDLDQVVAWDARFHEAITRAAHNRLLEQAMVPTAAFLTEARHRMHALPGEVERSIAAHERILLAIQRQEPEEAGRAMREHLRVVERDLGIQVP